MYVNFAVILAILMFFFKQKLILISSHRPYKNINEIFNLEIM